MAQISMESMNISRKIYLSSILLVCFSFNILGTVDPLFGKPVERVTLQLKWKHQFQFAGYYAAIEKGYYSDAGLEVRLKEIVPGIKIVDEVVEGRADYGIDMPGILLERQKGKPIVLLAAIFQHSPEILIARKDSGITNPQDLTNKIVMLRHRGNYTIRAMLLSEGVDIRRLNIVTHTWDLKDLIKRRIDAMSAYITDRPFAMKKSGVPYSMIRPISYGIDFYGDCLITTEGEILRHPKRVRAFLKASIKGWEYAMAHQEEIADLIVNKYDPDLSKEALLYEAKTMEKLMLPELVEIGHINPGRWKRIADTFVQLGMLKPDYSLKGFIYDPDSSGSYEEIMKIVWLLLSGLVLISFGAVVLFFFNRKLDKEVKKSTRQLYEEKMFTDAVIKSLPGIFYVYEHGERLIRWNENLQQEAGMTDSELLNIHPLYWFENREKEKIREKLKDLFEKGELSVEANVTFRKEEVPYYLTGTMLTVNEKKFLIGVGINMSEKKLLEEQLRHAQKMESIGRLAGGIAHDFNNVLSVVLGYSQLLLNKMPPEDPLRSKVEVILSAGKKASALIRQLLAFSRKQILETKPVSINRIVKDLLSILEKMLGEDIEIEVCLDAERGIIEADQSQIEQVFMNLAVNARDAMPYGGRLIIETRDIVLDKEYSRVHLGVEPGSYVMIAITDFGEGMTEEVMEHLFDPFFTTKEKGKGTGLGLATVHGIIRQHKGQIYVYSELGKGTTFKIYLPASDKSIEESVKMQAPLSPGGETILVVDDEQSIRGLIVDILEPLGYKCLEASRGAEAAHIVNSYDEDIHLLLTDVIMPGMSGKELAKVFSEKYPNAGVIFMSGYTENSVAHHGVLEQNVNYIPKPITPSALTAKIRSVLDR